MSIDIQTEPVEASPETADPRIPPRDDVVVRNLIERWNRECPDKAFVVFEDGANWTYAELREKVLQTALGLQQMGVGQGDHVIVWLPNSPENLRVFLALNYLGAVYVGINTSYRGNLLAHVVNISDARLIVAHADLAPRLAEIDTAKLERLIGVAGTAEIEGLDCRAYADVLLPEKGTIAAPERTIEPWDPHQIIFTSGTTGPSKAVLCSYLHLYSNAGPESWPCVTGEDRYLVNLPMFHIGGSGITYNMLVRGGSITLVDRFDTASFWEVIRKTETTATFLLGVMAQFIEKLPETASDADNPLRVMFMVPLAGDIRKFAARFGVEVYTIFNMTEVSTPIFSEPNPEIRGTCGKARAGVEVRLVDDNDCEVPVGEIGEMMVRTDRPWAMNSGYYNNAEATAKAWRNGWFHTGDAFRMDGEGNFYFVDRMKDAIRRRGENISSFEVEAEVGAHPAVREVAAIAVPNEMSEDEVMVVCAPVEGREIDPVDLIEFLKPRMAHFMVPRYVRVVAELPKTPTAKVQKAELRKEGVTDDTWDREAAGIRLKGDRLARAC
ncbi:AMP-binding protein [Minwuia thermotolerans]|uniref:ATP-dependent acyl-CoA ligase n=1 Tax=Minwuia thermotolerans TaxID=2056226 RepID=A0A2M9FVJ0_9PROT|nr:AMP-binding protein [Minwuia thermotolerans]PJK27498.1 ATP-dependent acyl-CoA ligase [Minwuia thermotolerans]